MRRFNLASYPNLELLEYRFLEGLKKTNHIVRIKEVRTEMFLQTWGSTALGFDTTSIGEPVFGGQAMTDAYTSVFEVSMEVSVKETQMVEPISVRPDSFPVETEVEKIEHRIVYGVAFGDDLCYMVENPTEEFFRDLTEHNLKPMSFAREHY